MVERANAAQIEAWNGEVGRKWLHHEATVEAMMADVSDRLMERAAVGPGDRVLEVGCGGGGLSVRLARAVGRDGAVLGLDVSARLLARAEGRRAEAGLAQLSFREADAQVAALPEAGFTHLVSQFGVMFFADPVAAFANLRRALRPGARVVLAAQASIGDSAFFALAWEAAVARLGRPEKGGVPGAPGPFAFADLRRTEGILREAGFAEVRGEAVDMLFRIPGGLGEAAEIGTRIGAGGARIREAGASEAERLAVVEALRGAFAPYAGPDGVALPGRFNLFEARRP